MTSKELAGRWDRDGYLVATLDNGCLWVLPGSHRWGFLERDWDQNNRVRRSGTFGRNCTSRSGWRRRYSGGATYSECGGMTLSTAKKSRCADRVCR